MDRGEAIEVARVRYVECHLQLCFSYVAGDCYDRTRVKLTQNQPASLDPTVGCTPVDPGRVYTAVLIEDSRSQPCGRSGSHVIVVAILNEAFRRTHLGAGVTV